MRSFLFSLAALFLAATAHAQQPVLPGAPQPNASPATAVSPPAVYYVLGQNYLVKLRSGSQFRGRLTTISLDKLEFDTLEMGHVTILRTDIAEIMDVASKATVGLRPGYYDIGNGNRLFFGPTARNLRKGEGAAQDVLFFLAGVNYGITDNISVGGYATLIPGVPLQYQLLLLTPKISVPVRENLHLGVGVLYIRIPDYDNLFNNNNSNNSYNAGLVYGAATWGSADNNVTAGLGYGFFENNIGSTPVLLLGGQRRVSRKISLISENYIIADHEAGMGGLYGLKFNWRQTSFGYAAGYAVAFGSVASGESRVACTYVYPVYLDFSFRFGKPYQAPVQY
ncbi:MAG: hypothetical protein ACRYFX_02055 [Janthinobacterium lividum]